MIYKRLFQWWQHRKELRLTVQRQRLETLLPSSVTSVRRARAEKFLAKQLAGEEYYAMEFEGVKRD